jgi:anaerobic magnesium-protoporphyrin IX monomethyl ester cyclase
MRPLERASVLFVLPPGGGTPHFAEHLGTAFLRAVLLRAGIRSAQYLPRRNPSLAGFVRFLRERRPAMVGITAYESNLRASRALVGTVREALPEAVVGVGGPNATFSPDETLELLGADLCLRGAGEATIDELVRRVLGGGAPRRRLAEVLQDLPNLAIRTAEGVRHTRAGDLSSFPGGRYRCLDDLPSPYQAGLLSTADVGLLTARGCNQHCTYCSFAAISGRRVRYHGVARVLDDLAAFKAVVDRVQRRRPTISISDDAFTLAPRRAREICEGIIRRRLQLPFECETRADRVDPELLRLMKRAGFTSISFGLESAVPRVLRAVGKVQDPHTRDDPRFEAERAYVEAFRTATSAAKAAGLVPTVSVIGGLPAETADDFRATLAFVDSLGVPMYVHNVLTSFPGTPLHAERGRHGLRAGRVPGSLRWETRHAYDVHAVRPLRNSLLHAQRWEEAEQIADALCGRPRPEHAGGGGAWAVVLHGSAPEAGVARWISRVLAVYGAVVVVDAAGEVPDVVWLRVLDEAEVPWGLFAPLSGEGGPDGRVVLRSRGTLGAHRFELAPAWRAVRGVEADDEGGCTVPLWIASASPAPPPADRRSDPLAPAPQVADGCRWWSGWRRCRRPRVLHVSADWTVRPCWNGPAIGRVGDGYRELARRGAALGVARKARGSRPDPCPLARECPGRRGSAAAERYDLAAQLEWLLRGGVVAGPARSEGGP